MPADMDVNRSESIAPVANREPRADQRAKHQRDEEDVEDDDQSHDDSWTDEEAVEFEGTLSGAVTPEVQAALEALASQLEPMRVELERARERETALRSQLDRHTYLPVLNRNGLEHEVARICGRLQTQNDSVTASPLFVCVSVRNAPELRRRLGRSAYDQAMNAACTILKSCFTENDVYGCLGGDDLGIIVWGSAEADGPAPGDYVADRIISAFAATPARINDGFHVLSVDVGVSSLQDNPTFSAALAAADANLMRRTGA